MTTRDCLQSIFATYQKHGHRQYGETVTELQHALQTATFARQRDESDAMVAAALLHDFGHLLHSSGEEIAQQGIDMRHENLGANHLAAHFSSAIVEPIRLHVEAKRYLCWADPAYLAELSGASQLSLRLQGGPMDAAEAAQFQRHEYYSAALRLRRYDDMGKVPGMATPALEDFRAMLAALLVG
ncbi:MAG: HD domain-containing protein [Pegethrix bostrychoides GSE-TBD4-15B]|jgi:phosphonate degradation associated HDIG domain protein|uniref:HD domain-containing protein n=1 Tax=Pegethrix bostrychoides GSE-TBD4-15B TaxID=2839662 RepID=A0A951PE25_9CYAN|nr:HD domain-containing protein [Pegethrix bostrychoides GSE-TBD4-15B]